MLGPATSKLTGVTPTMVLIVVMLVAVLVPQAQAAFPGRNGALMVTGISKGIGCAPMRVRAWIADEEPGCGSSTFLVGPGRRSRVWSEGNGAAAGRFSPGGTRVALFTVGEPLTTTSVALLRGGRAAPRRRLRVRGQRPAWSPDGRRLVYEEVSYDGAGDEQGVTIKTVMLAGARARTLVAGCEPLWSSRGEIAFLRYPSVCGGTSAADSGLFVMRADGSAVRRVVAPDRLWPDGWPSFVAGDASGVFDWSPDGRRIVFTDANRVSVVGADVRGRRAITGYATYATPTRPLWSPDGRWIAFAAYGGDAGPVREENTVFLVPADSRPAVPPKRWRRLISSARPLDWQALPTLSGR